MNKQSRRDFLQMGLGFVISTLVPALPDPPKKVNEVIEYIFIGDRETVFRFGSCSVMHANWLEVTLGE